MPPNCSGSLSAVFTVTSTRAHFRATSAAASSSFAGLTSKPFAGKKEAERPESGSSPTDAFVWVDDREAVVRTGRLGVAVVAVAAVGLIVPGCGTASSRGQPTGASHATTVPLPPTSIPMVTSTTTPKVPRCVSTLEDAEVGLGRPALGVGVSGEGGGQGSGGNAGRGGLPSAGSGVQMGEVLVEHLQVVLDLGQVVFDTSADPVMRNTAGQSVI